jgi:glycosyltransferase involved in cell wall biosynthesis
MQPLVERAMTQVPALASASAPADRIEQAVAERAPVSVVMPCYRCTESVRSTVASIAAQTLLPSEVILVDDCSGDGTLQLLHEIAREHAAGWIHVIAMPANMGPSGARNAGWARAGQPYVAFLDADDSWHPLKLELQMAVLHADPALALLGHAMDVRDRDVPPRPLQWPSAVMRIRRHTMLLTNPFPTASVILRRDLPFRFDERLRRAEDFLLWAQIVLSGHRSARIQQVLASWHKPPFGAGGLSGDLAAMNKAGIDVRNQLRRDGLMTWPELQCAHLWSAVRHVRRRVIDYLRRSGPSQERRSA